MCDDIDDGKPWYLLDTKGNMVAGLASDSGKLYFLGSNGKLKLDSDYYYGVYLDIDNSTGVIKNKSFPLEIPIIYVSTTKTIYTSSFNNNDDAVQFSENDILDYDTAVAYVRQLVGGARIEGVTGNSIRVIGNLPMESILIERSRNDIVCAFVNNSNDKTLLYLSRTAKNIREAINQLNRWKTQKK